MNNTTITMKTGIFLLFLVSALYANTQQNKGGIDTGLLNKLGGKYETNGMIIQIIPASGYLQLLVPGAPVQELRESAPGRFKSDAFSDEVFRFEEKDGKIDKLISERAGNITTLQKISDKTDNFNSVDSVLVAVKWSKHFKFYYGKENKSDGPYINRLIQQLEGNYDHILKDLKVKEIPAIIVRIYPDLSSFRQGINYPNAPDFIQATAFGKADFRIVSPAVTTLDSISYLKGAVHELTHCIHLNIDYAPNNPRWLWEGLAMFESDWSFDPKEIEIIKNKQFPHLSELGNGMEYMLGYVIIEAIRDIWGQDTIISLIKKRGKVTEVLNLPENEFEKQVFDHIYKKYINE
jgi:hypothetical protein